MEETYRGFRIVLEEKKGSQIFEVFDDKKKHIGDYKTLQRARGALNKLLDNEGNVLKDKPTVTRQSGFKRARFDSDWNRREPVVITSVAGKRKYATDYEVWIVSGGERSKEELGDIIKNNETNQKTLAELDKKYAEKEKLLQEIKELTASLERFNLKDIDSRYTNEDEEND